MAWSRDAFADASGDDQDPLEVFLLSPRGAGSAVSTRSNGCIYPSTAMIRSAAPGGP